MEKENTEYRVRRVGSVTFGVVLICYGVLFLVHAVCPSVRYEYIFRIWPVIFILLGCEILAEDHKSRTGKCKIVYDFAAVVMLGLMLLFAMALAVVDYGITHGQFWYGVR